MDTPPVPWAGGNHLALVTDNLECTTRLWHGVMVAPLVATLGTEAFRPYGFNVRRGATVAFCSRSLLPLPVSYGPPVCRVFSVLVEVDLTRATVRHR